MHPRIDQLLSWRDGAPVDVATREHAEQCTTCAAAVRRLTERQRSLQELPQFEAPDIEYSRILARAQEVRSPASNAGNRLRAVAAAAIVAAVVAQFVVIDRRQNHGPQQVQVDSNAAEAVPIRHEQGDPAVARLVEQSRELDELLQKMPRRPEVQRVSMAGTVDRIEQRVQWLDVQLSAVPAGAADDSVSRRLWRERVDLMDSLVAMRYAESMPQLF